VHDMNSDDATGLRSVIRIDSSAVPSAPMEPREAGSEGRLVSSTRSYVELGGIRTRAAQMIHVLETIDLIATIDAPVLISGETGTGKELVARALHGLSSRSHRDMVTIQCGALPESLAESELFGHERGAFTGAERSYVGRIEAANGGTLFLDEVNSLPLATQTKLLRFLEMNEIPRIGRQRPVIVDVRLISATNVSLESLVAAGGMRADFFYRLNVLVIEIPPLRERLCDVPLLVEQFLREDPLAKRLRVTVASDEVIANLMSWRWPGNVRELRNVLRRSLVRGADQGILRRIDAGHAEPHRIAPTRSVSNPATIASYRAWMREREREYFSDLTKRCTSVAEQGRASGLPPRTLYRKIRSLCTGLPHTISEHAAEIRPSSGHGVVLA